MAPHAPYRRHPPEWDATLFTDMPPGGERRYPFAETRWWGQGAIPGSVQIGDEQRVGEYVNRYDRGVRWADTLIGAFLGRMRAANLMEDTLLIVTSDHGEGLGEHGVFAHEVFLYDFLVRVPLVVRYPRRVPGGLVVDEQVQLVDIVPTVLGLIGGPAPEGLDGLDLSPRLRGEVERLPERFALAHYANRGLQRMMVRSDDFKLIFDPGTGVEEFYHLAGDPQEVRNLAGPELPPALRPTYAAHREALREMLARSAQDPPRPPAELSDAVREELRSLGYVE